MKLPNNYGSVYKLSGNRRRPYIAKITIGYNNKGKQSAIKTKTLISIESKIK